MTALRGSPFIIKAEGAPQVANETRENNANFVWVQHFNRIQSRTLATMRDTPLPNLLFGELSVAEVEKEVSA